MRTTLTIALAAVISLTVLTALEWSSTRHLPRGQVTIVQIEEPTATAPLAQAEVDSQVVRTAGSL